MTSASRASSGSAQDATEWMSARRNGELDDRPPTLELETVIGTHYKYTTCVQAAGYKNKMTNNMCVFFLLCFEQTTTRFSKMLQV